MPKGVYQRQHTSAESRFWPKVEKGGAGDCWEWTANKTPFGYGKIFGPDEMGRRRGLKAHRVSWNIHHGPIPLGRIVMHTCDNPGCVNPAHLRLGSYRDNNLDKAIKGRGTATQSPGNVRLVRLAHGLGASCYTISQALGVHKSAVYAMIVGKTYSYIKDHHNER